MSNYKALIAEVTSEFQKYSDSGLIDENSLYRDIVKGVKRFGNDITTLQETVVTVKNGQVKLPDNFHSLYVAALCEPLGYEKSPNIEIHDLQSSYFYRERTSQKNTWNECNPCCKEQEENIIKENLYFKQDLVSFYYKNPVLLKLGKTFLKDSCHAKCRNKIVRDNPNEIVINGVTLYTNFDEGSIYMQYYGLPMDEDGQLDIPDTNTGHLETYLEYYLKRRLAERLMGNNDAQGLSNLYSIYKQEEQVALRNASNELKMARITPTSMKRIRRINKLESLTYETNIRRWA